MQRLGFDTLIAAQPSREDVSSSYFESSTCPLARIGYSRDGRKNKTQVQRVRERFGIERFVVVGGRWSRHVVAGVD